MAVYEETSSPRCLSLVPRDQTSSQPYQHKVESEVTSLLHRQSQLITVVKNKLDNTFPVYIHPCVFSNVLHSGFSSSCLKLGYD